MNRARTTASSLQQGVRSSTMCEKEGKILFLHLHSFLDLVMKTQKVLPMLLGLVCIPAVAT